MNVSVYFCKNKKKKVASVTLVNTTILKKCEKKLLKSLRMLI